MNNKLVIFSIFYLILNNSTSQAADIIYQSPEVPAYNETAIWSGTYIGAQLGYTWSRQKLNFTDQNLGSYKATNKGIMGGIYAGYNWEFSNSYLFGFEGDLNYSNLRQTKDMSSFQQDTSWTSRLEWEGAVRARFGINYERILPYIAAGIAFAGIKEIITNPTTSYSSKNTLVGYTIGTGIDYALTNNLLLRAEYRYSDYGNISFVNSLVDLKVKISTNNIRLGIAYKF